MDRTCVLVEAQMTNELSTYKQKKERYICCMKRMRWEPERNGSASGIFQRFFMGYIDSIDVSGTP